MTHAGELYGLIKDVFLLLDDGDRRLLSQYELTVPRFYALFHLGERPGLSASELSDLMLCDKSNITRLIKGLEAESLVLRRPHETDGRTYRLFLTAEGWQLRERVLDEHRAKNRARFDSTLELVEQEYLLSTLQQLRNSLQSEMAAN